MQTQEETNTAQITEIQTQVPQAGLTQPLAHTLAVGMVSRCAHW